MGGFGIPSPLPANQGGAWEAGYEACLQVCSRPDAVIAHVSQGYACGSWIKGSSSQGARLRVSTAPLACCMQFRAVLVLMPIRTQRSIIMVQYAGVTNLRIKCHRKNRRKLGLGRIYACSYYRKYSHCKIVTTTGPTLVQGAAQAVHKACQSGCAAKHARVFRGSEIRKQVCASFRAPKTPKELARLHESAAPAAPACVWPQSCNRQGWALRKG